MRIKIPFHRLFTRRKILWALFAVALVVTLWAAFCAEELWRGRRKWEAYRAAAIARGTELTLAELLPGTVPDAENFAAIPLVQELFRDPPAPPRWFPGLKLEGEKQPSFGDATTGEPIDLAAWRELFLKNGVLAQAGASAADDVLAALAKGAPELALLRDAARRPHARFPVAWERGFEARLPHLSPVREAARLHGLAMAAHLARGDSAAARAAFADGLAMYRVLRAEPVLITGLVRIAIVSQLVDSVQLSLAAGQWAEPELREIERDLASLDLAADWQFSLASERVLMNSTFESLLAKSNRDLATLLQAVGATGPTPAATAISLYPRGWLYLSQVKLNEFTDRSIARSEAIAAAGLAGAPPDPLDEVARLKGRALPAQLPYLLYLLAAPAVGTVEKNYLRTMAQLAQAQTACALERHRLARGNFPETLAALAPDFLAELPRDPIDHTPLRYRRTEEGGFLLWSIGLDRRDDGGSTGGKKAQTEQADWVWPR